MSLKINTDIKISNKIKNSIELLTKIERLGYEAYIVGGAVRDMLVGREVVDVDIATNCPIEVLEKEFITYDIGRSKDFGICGVLFHDTFYEVAQFRIDGKYNDKRHPDTVIAVKTIDEDIQRRDFTINAMALGSDGRIIDKVGGKADLDNKIIRTVGKPSLRIEEDALRMIRAARFAARFNFSLTPELRRTIRKLSPSISNVAQERIYSEFDKVAKRSGSEFAEFIILLDRLALLSKILPEIVALKYRFHNLQHHPEGKSVFCHTIECLKCLDDQPAISKFATLFHDVGKAIAFEDTGAYMTFHRHEHAGLALIREICRRFCCDNYTRDAILFATKHHMQFHKIFEMKPSKIARLVNSPHFETLVDVVYADEFSRGETFMYHNQFYKKLSRAKEIGAQWIEHLTSTNKRLVSGNFIMQVVNIPPSKLVGTIKREVENIIMDKSLNPEDYELIAKIIQDVYNELEGAS